PRGHPPSLRAFPDPRAGAGDDEGAVVLDGRRPGPPRLPLARQRAPAALGRGALGALRAGRGPDPAGGPARPRPRAAVDALGGPRPAPVAEGRGAGLHPLRARPGGRQPDAGRHHPGHQPKGAVGEAPTLRNPLMGSRTRMEQKKMKAFREKLLAKKQEILEVYTKTKTYGQEADQEGSQDVADKASSSYTNEFLFSLSKTERELLQEVDEALNRIDDRRFGVCLSCEDEMNLKRLEAVPWARHCVPCQEKQEQGLL